MIVCVRVGCNKAVEASKRADVTVSALQISNDDEADESDGDVNTMMSIAILRMQRLKFGTNERV